MSSSLCPSTSAFLSYPVSSAGTEESDNGTPAVLEQACPEDRKSHDVSESSPGPEPTGPSHSGEDRDAANSVREPETTPPADASERSVSSEFVISQTRHLLT